jgi:hypothetical protein
MTFGQRVAGVLTLSASTFEDIEADQRASTQALAVVVLASVAGGIGAGLLFGPLALLTETFAALIGWVMWAGVTYVIGTKLFPEPQTQSDMGELLRVIGFSYAPQVFNVFAFVPLLGRGVRVFVALWLLAATIVAVRQALDYRSTWRAVAVVLIGWWFFVIIQLVFSVGPS